MLKKQSTLNVPAKEMKKKEEGSNLISNIEPNINSIISGIDHH